MNRISILGAGESGVGAAILAKSKGFDVFVSDGGRISDSYRTELVQHGIQFEENHHTESLVLNASRIIKSPGIPESAPIVSAVGESKIPMISELEFAYHYCEGKIISITGTNGKTTTTLLTHHLLAEGGLNVAMAGNVGNSFARKIYQDRREIYVLEVSSFQWDGMVDFRSDLGILLNITPDHLDRYENNLQNYVASKFTILNNMGPGDGFIYFKDDPIISSELAKREAQPVLHPISLIGPVENGAFLSEGELVFSLEGGSSSDVSIPTDVLRLKGRHNLVNTMASIMTGLLHQLSSEKMAKDLRKFSNAPHRLELVEEINDIRFINDSKATNVDSTYYALGAYHQPIIWIAGGVDKGNNYDILKGLALENVKTLICLGKDNTALKLAFQHLISDIFETQSMGEAVGLAYSLAESGEVVLLSPACASFDLFDNYEDRGDQYKEEIRIMRHRIENNKILVL